MCLCTVRSVITLIVVQSSFSQSLPRVPPKFENKPLLLDSYIPAAMQLLAYLTELMKYDLRPSPTTPSYGRPTTTSTIRPTPSHRPAIYAPVKPPGPEAYFDSLRRGITYRDYVESLKHPSGLNYFDRYYEFNFNGENKPSSQYVADSINHSAGDDEVPEDIELYFGKNYLQLLELVKTIEPDVVSNDLDDQAQEFLKKYDDSNFRVELLRQKQIPPTKAYVTLLSLYDLLSKESKRLGMSKYSGYTDRILKELSDSSTSTSAYQLRVVMNKVIERDDTKKPDIVKKIKEIVNDLDESNSYINLALRYIPPLSFAL
ncbi:ecdysone-inducible gene E3 [Leptinotarsa decemlineata]|uniref:ecdysone-inducible gene E3 n=1 Tax=Leptinotarsa decemlineata TaxID=7539 RepID=UPI003D30936E